MSGKQINVKALSTADLSAICEQQMDLIAKAFPDAVIYLADYIQRLTDTNIALCNTIMILQAEAFK